MSERPEWKEEITKRLAGLRLEPVREIEITEELAQHLEDRYKELVSGGATEDEARRLVLEELRDADFLARELGGIVREAPQKPIVLGHPGAGNFLASLWQDLRYGLRQLRRNPGFTAVAVLTLALGIGATTAIFSVVNGVLLKPLPYPHSEQLVSVLLNAPGANWFNVGLGPSDYFTFRDQNRTFQDIGLYRDDLDNVTGVGEPERVRELDVTDGLLPILDMPPLLGRWFDRQDSLPSSPRTAILTYGYWKSKFGGDREVIGRTIVLDGEPHEIIGVMPKRFHFLDQPDPALILPLRFNRDKTDLGNFDYEGLARLKPGEIIAKANADLVRLIPIVWRSFPPPPGFSLELFKKAHFGPHVVPLKQAMVGDVSKLLWVVMGGIGMVLLIACANVANLLLVRTEGRQQELAIRAALGATRDRLATELLFESLIIGLIGGALGLGFAYGALRILVAIAPSGLPRLDEIGIDAHTLLFSLGVALLASLLFGSVSVLKYAGARLGTGLREVGRILGQSRERHRVQNILVAVQIGLAFVLLVCSGLTIRTFRALAEVEPGFVHPGDVQTFRVHVSNIDVSSAVNVVRAQEEIAEKIAALPDITSVGFSSSVPMDGNGSLDIVFAKDRTYAQGEIPPLRHFIFVSPGYFHTMGIPLIAGRDVTWSDTYNMNPVGNSSGTLVDFSGQIPANRLAYVG